MLRRALPLYAVLTIFFCWPLFEKPAGLGILDWDQHLFLYAAVAKSFFAFHQLPFWNPWYCGGNLLWQNPEVAIFSPVYPLSLLMPLQVAMKVNIALHVFMGFLGMHLLLRRTFHAAQLVVVLFLSTIFVCCGALALHIGVGHATFLTFFYLPVALHFSIGAMTRGSWRAAALAGAVLALAAWNGGMYTIIMFGVGLAVMAGVLALATRRVRPLVCAALVVIATGLYAAPKLLPIATAFADPQLVDSREGVGDGDTLSWTDVKTTLSSGERPANWISYYEFGNYIGGFACFVILGAFVFWLSAKPTPDRAVGLGLVAAAVFLLLAARGPFAAWSPFALFQHLPVLSRLRVPSRYTIVFVLFAVAGVAEMLRQVAPGVSLSPAARRVAAVVLLLACADIVSQNRRELIGVFAQDPASLRVPLTSAGPAPTHDFTTSGSAPHAMMEGIRDNRDVVQCYLLIGPPIAVQRDLDFVWTDRSVNVRHVTYTPNRIDVDVAVRESGRVGLNQNFFAGWTSTAGKFGRDASTGLGAATLPAGFAGTVSLSFVPRGFYAGLIVFVLAIAGTIVTARRKSATIR